MLNNNHIKAYAQQQYLVAEDGLVQAQKDGANHWYIDGSFSEEYPDNWTNKRIANLVAAFEKTGITPLFHGNFKAPLSSDVPAIREAATKSVYSEIDLAAKLNAPLILHGGAIVEPRLVIKAKRTALDHYLQSLKEIISYAEKKDVCILLENLSNYKHYRPFHYIFTQPEEYRYVFDRIESTHVKFFFDVGHAAICEGNPYEVIREFHHLIWGMSLSNNDGSRDLHVAINQGVIDYQEIASAIIETNWQGVIAFEVRGRGFQQCKQDLDGYFAKARAMIEPRGQNKCA